MCSIVEGDFGDEGAAHAMPVAVDNESILVGSSEICKKCNSETVILKLATKEAQCRSCFLNYVHHKFRAALGSTKILPRGANVLIVVDGSAKSVVLMDMCRFALQQDRFKKLQFNPKILYIDKQPLLDASVSQKVVDIIKSFSFESFYQPLGSTSEPHFIDDHFELGTFSETSRSEFMDGYHSLSSLTSKQDFLVQYEKKMWRSAAKAFNCNLVFVPETNVDLAKCLLTDISLGRGLSAAHDVCFVDDRVNDVKLVRPIRDLSEAEVNHYVRLNDLEVVPEANITFHGDSIQNLTDAFVRNLQKNYASTIATVFRTGDKLAPSKKEILKQCRMCQSLVDTTGSETLYATEVSSCLSTRVPKNEFSQVNGDDLTMGGNSSETSELCHACLSITRDTTGAKDFIFAFNESC